MAADDGWTMAINVDCLSKWCSNEPLVLFLLKPYRQTNRSIGYYCIMINGQERQGFGDEANSENKTKTKIIKTKHQELAGRSRTSNPTHCYLHLMQASSCAYIMSRCRCHSHQLKRHLHLLIATDNKRPGAHRSCHDLVASLFSLSLSLHMSCVSLSDCLRVPVTHMQTCVHAKDTSTTTTTTAATTKVTQRGQLIVG